MSSVDDLRSRLPPPGVRLSRLLGAGAYGNLYVGHLADGDLFPTTNRHPHHPQQQHQQLQHPRQQQWLEDSLSTAGNRRHFRSAVYVKVLTPDAAVPGPREIDRLRQLDHPNIVRLLAVVGGGDDATSRGDDDDDAEDFRYRQTSSSSPTVCCLLYEYVEHGVDLVQYLTTVDRLNRSTSPAAATAMTSTVADWRCSVAVQVASGLVYLSSLGLVHRDVAARNVIVSGRLGGGGRRYWPTFSTDDETDSEDAEAPATSTPIARLSDFSLSRRPYAADYVPLMTGTVPGQPEEEICRLVPLRWSAPEALVAGRHSEATDSWSFGVLAWELYVGRGLERPYVDIDDDQLFDSVSTVGRPPGLRLPAGDERPATPAVPSFVRQLIVDCTELAPGRRPRFGDIVERLRNNNNNNNTNTTAAASLSSSSAVCRMYDIVGDGPHIVPTTTTTTGFNVSGGSSGASPEDAGSTAHLLTSPTGVRSSPLPVVPIHNHQQQQQRQQQHHVTSGCGGGWPAPPPAAWWAASPTPSAKRLQFKTSVDEIPAASSTTPRQLSQQQQQQIQQQQSQHYKLQQPARLADVVL